MTTTMKTCGNEPNAFILGNKSKAWIVWKDGQGTTIIELKDYYIGEMNVTNTFDNLPMNFELDEKSWIQTHEPCHIRLDLYCNPESLVFEYGDTKKMGPENFYSIPELKKLSKIITKKMTKLKERV